MRILSVVRRNRAVVPRLRRVGLALMLKVSHFGMHPVEVVTEIVMLFVEHLNFIAELFVFMAAGAQILVEVADVIGCCHDY